MVYRKSRDCGKILIPNVLVNNISHKAVIPILNIHSTEQMIPKPILKLNPIKDIIIYERLHQVNNTTISHTQHFNDHENNSNRNKQFDSTLFAQII